MNLDINEQKLQLVVDSALKRVEDALFEDILAQLKKCDYKQTIINQVKNKVAQSLSSEIRDLVISNPKISVKLENIESELEVIAKNMCHDMLQKKINNIKF